MPLNFGDKSKLTLLGLGAGISAYNLMQDKPSSTRIGITLLGLTGAGTVYYLMQKYPQGEIPEEEKIKEKERKTLTINLKPIIIPASVGETRVRKIANKLKPEVKPVVDRRGVKLYWEPIAVSFGFGDIKYQPPSKFLPIEDLQKARRIAKKLGPTIRRVPAGWQIEFKTITVEV